MRISSTPYRFNRISSALRMQGLTFITSGQFRNRSQNIDKFRETIREILAQVPHLTQVPADYHRIPKEVFGTDHWCYYYTEKLSTLDRNGQPLVVTVEFHVDPTDGFCEVYVEDAKEGTLFAHFQSDLEDWAPAEIDEIDNAIASFEQAGSQPAEPNQLASSSRKISSAYTSDNCIGQDPTGDYKVYKTDLGYELSIDGRIDRYAKYSDPTVESTLDKWGALFNIEYKPEYRAPFLASSKKPIKSEVDPRPASHQLLDMIDEGIVDTTTLARDLINWMDDNDVERFAELHGFFDNREE